MKPLIVQRNSPTNGDPTRLAFSVLETAQLLGCSERSIRTWIKVGRIHARKSGGRVFISAESIKAFLADSNDDAGTESNK